MSKGINKVILIDNLGNDAETHYFTEGKNGHKSYRRDIKFMEK
jgi:single-stranded DNA-binding protein